MKMVDECGGYGGNEVSAVIHPVSIVVSTNTDIPQFVLSITTQQQATEEAPKPQSEIKKHIMNILSSYKDYDYKQPSLDSVRRQCVYQLAEALDESNGEDYSVFDSQAKNLSNEIVLNLFDDHGNLLPLEKIDDFRLKVINHLGKRNDARAKKEKYISKYLNDLVENIVKDDVKQVFNKQLKEMVIENKKNNHESKARNRGKYKDNIALEKVNKNKKVNDGKSVYPKDVPLSKTVQNRNLPKVYFNSVEEVPCLFDANPSTKEINEIVNILKENFEKDSDFASLSRFNDEHIRNLASRLFPKNIATIISWGSHALLQQQAIYNDTFELINQFKEIKGQDKLDDIINKANNRNTKTTFLSSWFSKTSKTTDKTDVVAIKTKLDTIIVPIEKNFTRIKNIALPLWIGLLSAYNDYIETTGTYSQDVAYQKAILERRKLLYDVAQQTEMIEKQLSQMRMMIIETRSKVDYIENVVLPNMFMASKDVTVA